MKKQLVLGILSFSLSFMVSCGQKLNEKVTKEKETAIEQNQDEITCSNFACLEKNKNKDLFVEGLFRKYTPNETGKGANYMFWDWEVLLDDGNAVPVISKNDKLDLSYYEDKKVLIKGNAFYGIIIGGENPEEQSATGYRIDINSIQEK